MQNISRSKSFSKFVLIVSSISRILEPSPHGLISIYNILTCGPMFILRKEQNSENPKNNLCYQIGLLSVMNSFLRFGHVHVDTQKQQ